MKQRITEQRRNSSIKYRLAVYRWLSGFQDKHKRQQGREFAEWLSK